MENRRTTANQVAVSGVDAAGAVGVATGLRYGRCWSRIARSILSGLLRRKSSCW
jgi:hypothetical protein